MTSPPEPIVLLGGGGHCHACIDVVEAEGRFTIAGILDPALTPGAQVLGYPVLGDDAEIPGLRDRQLAFLITIGQIRSAQRRAALFAELSRLGGRLPVIVSPRAHLSRHATVADGTILLHGAVVNAGAAIGANAIINSLALVEHDALVGSHCHIATGAIVNGGAVVEDGCLVGSGAVIREGVHIGAGSLVGAGVTVLRNLPAGSLVRAPPAPGG
ncbi:MAG: NeuD/PglB/VioB family sugar acetyltransferase [Thermodesulfobacteriota bacterium]